MKLDQMKSALGALSLEIDAKRTLIAQLKFDAKQSGVVKDRLRRRIVDLEEIVEESATARAEQARTIDYSKERIASLENQIERNVDYSKRVAELEEAATVRMVADAGIGTVPIGIKLKEHMEKRIAALEDEVEELTCHISERADGDM